MDFEFSPEQQSFIAEVEAFLDAMTKPRHPERKNLIQWYGRVFDPDDIGLAEINARIAKLARRRTIGKAAFAKSQGKIN